MRRRIGLLGGSFNPAHTGHLDIGRAALAQCALHEIWWLISPQNSLKSTEGMASYGARKESVHAIIATHPHMRIASIEKEISSRYTAETVRYLKKRHPDCAFLWIMGADNLVQMDRWKEWKTLFHMVPIVIFDRSGYTYSALKAKAAQFFSDGRLPERQAKLLVTKELPAWIFVNGRLNPISASAIRARSGSLNKPSKQRLGAAH